MCIVGVVSLLGLWLFWEFLPLAGTYMNLKVEADDGKKAGANGGHWRVFSGGSFTIFRDTV